MKGSKAPKNRIRRVWPGGSRGRRRAVPAGLVTLLIAVSMLLAGCSGSGAEAKVRADLDMLQSSKAAGSQLTEMRELLSKEGADDLDSFLSKVRDFDYEIIGSETHDRDDDHYTTVTVRIRTCDFGSGYLAAWTEYMREHGDAFSEDGDMSGFYDKLFRRLSALENKDYINDVRIVAIDPIDNGEWITNISSNEELQDALFGGMVSEMKALAGGDGNIQDTDTEEQKK